MNKVSVIIPIYNADKYLKRCLDSLINQSYSNIEVVMVNDGSSDNSESICKNYSVVDTRFKYVYQKNQGCSIARNNGFSVISGDYFMFVDADDYLESKAIEQLVERVEQYSCDVVIGPVNKESNATLEAYVCPRDKIVEFCVNQKQCIEENSFPQFTRYINPGSPWMKLIRKELYRDYPVLFPENIRYHHEDTLFCLELYKRANTVVLCDTESYRYDTQVGTSLCKTFHMQKIDEIIQIINQSKKYISEERLIYFFIMELILECWADYFTHKDCKLSWNDRKKSLYQLLENDDIKETIQNSEISMLKSHQRIAIQMMKKGKINLLCVMSVIQQTIKQRK